MKKKAFSAKDSNILNLVKHYWWTFALSFVLCFGVMFLYLRKTAPQYRISSMVHVDNFDPNFLGIGGKSSTSSALKALTGGSTNGVNVYNEIEILASESLLASVIEELGINRRYYEKVGFMKKDDLYNNSPIAVEAPKELFDTLSVSLNFRVETKADGKADITVKKGFFSNYAQLDDATLPATVKTPYGAFVVKKTPFYAAGHEYTINAIVAGLVPAAEELTKDISTKQKAKKTDLVVLSILDSDKDRGRDILNTIVRKYNERYMKEKDDQGLTTSNFINDRLNLIYKDLIGSEAEIEAYKKAHNMIDPSLQVKEIIGKSATSENAIVALETQMRIIGMVQSFLADPNNANSLIPFETDSLAAGAVKAYNSLITQRMRLETSATGDNQALAQIDQQLHSMRKNMLHSVNNSMHALQIKINQAKSINSEASGAASDIPTAERETRELYRSQAIQNELYIFLLQKREENALKIASAMPHGKVIDAAYASTKPEKPKKPLVVFITLLFAIGLPAAFVATRKKLDNKAEHSAPQESNHTASAEE